MEEFSLIDLAKEVWIQNLAKIIVFASLLLVIIAVMLFKDWFAKRKRLYRIVRYAILIAAFGYGGLLLNAQPTTMNIIILLNGLIVERQFPIGLFLMEPYIFLSFIFIAVTMLLWGRSVFCGWLCPYGAMLELLYKIRKALLPRLEFDVPDKVHWKLVYLKYIFFIVILALSFYNFAYAEYLSEIEPFRTFVLKLKREWYFVAYFGLLTVGSVIVYRVFCRYICPLGGALALPFFFKFLPIIKLKRYDFCSSCKICQRTCDPKAITADGKIISRECFYCLECQVNYWDENRCPVLIKRKKERETHHDKSIGT